MPQSSPLQGRGGAASGRPGSSAALTATAAAAAGSGHGFGAASVHVHAVAAACCSPATSVATTLC